MPIHNGDFARDCVNQGLGFEINPHFLLAVAFSLSAIKDDTDGDRIGPFRITQADWNAQLNDPIFDNSLVPGDINNPGMQCLFAAVQVRNAQDRLVKKLNRYPSANELYAEWPAKPALPADGLQSALNNTRALVLPAVESVLAGMDEGLVSGIDLSSIAPGERLDNANLIIAAFAAAHYGKIQQIAALANAIAESDLKAHAEFQTASEHSVGLFQLNMMGGLGSGHSRNELLDPARNTKLIIAKAQTVQAFGNAANLHDAVAIFVRKIEQPANQAGEIIKRFAIAEKFVA
jgi:hypothetical protein